jgi:septum formation protein
MLDKPESRAEALDQLRALSGQSHALHSAAAIAEGGRVTWRHVETARLVMRPLSEAFLLSYLDQEYPKVRGSVGAYHIEGRGAQLFDSVEGSHFAVLGLPLLPLLALLRERGFLAK